MTWKLIMSQKFCLLVDDDKFVTDLMAPLLKVRGYNPVSVHSGRDALRAIERSVPSFVILDINLPDMSGFDVLRGIRGNVGSSEVLVFMLTGRSDVVEIQLRSFDLGATEFFQKPVNPREMVEQIQDILWARKI
jgi:two-component system, OmpR family, KDP operon response regulator KdpE